MVKFKTNGNCPQIGKKTSKSHISKVYLTESEEGKISLSISGNNKSQKQLQQKRRKITNLTIGTYNIGSLNDDDKINEFEEELTNIKWGLIRSVKKNGK